jgi:hypothetical protein
MGSQQSWKVVVSNLGLRSSTDGQNIKELENAASRQLRQNRVQLLRGFPDLLQLRGRVTISRENQQFEASVGGKEVLDLNRTRICCPQKYLGNNALAHYQVCRKLLVRYVGE